MAPYIFAKRNAIHIIDIRETLRGILRAQKFLARVVARGDDVLFVGTKRQASEPIQQAAERCGMHYVNERWLGGTLTNFRTIRSRLERLEELEALSQSPQWETGYSKKMKSMLLRELERVRRNLSGIRRMTHLPGALLVIDVRKEINALREARVLGIPTVCLIDTDSDPDYVSIPIPGNDDAMRAIQFVCSKLADAIEEARRSRPEPPPRVDSSGADRGLAPRRRQRRVVRPEVAPAGVEAGAPVLAGAEGEAVPGFEASGGEPPAPTAG